MCSCLGCYEGTVGATATRRPKAGVFPSTVYVEAQGALVGGIKTLIGSPDNTLIVKWNVGSQVNNSRSYHFDYGTTRFVTILDKALISPSAGRGWGGVNLDTVSSCLCMFLISVRPISDTPPVPSADVLFLPLVRTNRTARPALNSLSRRKSPPGHGGEPGEEISPNQD